MTVLVATHPTFDLHDAGPGHPERPARLDAVRRGAREAAAADELRWFEAVEAPRSDIERVHPGAYLVDIERRSAAGGGHIDADTAQSAESAAAARLAAGAGLEAVRRLEAGEGSAAFCAVRPPGHHATPAQPMGFCLVNNVAVTAASLADAGHRVLVVDIDAHHGNGVQDAFYDDGRVVYVSFHQYPLYPGTGSLGEVGIGEGLGATVNFPLPAGATGEHYRAGIEEVVAPLAGAAGVDWLLVSVGYDAHRADPLAGLSLTAGDYADITTDLLALAPPGRRAFFLEGGYDLEAVALGTAATLDALAGEVRHDERPTSGGPGREVVAAVASTLGHLH